MQDIAKPQSPGTTRSGAAWLAISAVLGGWSALLANLARFGFGPASSLSVFPAILLALVLVALLHPRVLDRVLEWLGRRWYLLPVAVACGFLAACWTTWRGGPDFIGYQVGVPTSVGIATFWLLSGMRRADCVPDLPTWLLAGVAPLLCVAAFPLGTSPVAGIVANVLFYSAMAALLWHHRSVTEVPRARLIGVAGLLLIVTHGAFFSMTVQFRSGSSGSHPIGFLSAMPFMLEWCQDEKFRETVSPWTSPARLLELENRRAGVIDDRPTLDFLDVLVGGLRICCLLPFLSVAVILFSFRRRVHRACCLFVAIPLALVGVYTGVGYGFFAGPPRETGAWFLFCADVAVAISVMALAPGEDPIPRIPALYRGPLRVAAVIVIPSAIVCLVWSLLAAWHLQQQAAAAILGPLPKSLVEAIANYNEQSRHPALAGDKVVDRFYQMYQSDEGIPPEIVAELAPLREASRALTRELRKSAIPYFEMQRLFTREILNSAYLYAASASAAQLHKNHLSKNELEEAAAALAEAMDIHNVPSTVWQTLNLQRTLRPTLSQLVLRARDDRLESQRLASIRAALAMPPDHWLNTGNLSWLSDESNPVFKWPQRVFTLGSNWFRNSLSGISQDRASEVDLLLRYRFTLESLRILQFKAEKGRPPVDYAEVLAAYPSEEGDFTHPVFQVPFLENLQVITNPQSGALLIWTTKPGAVPASPPGIYMFSIDPPPAQPGSTSAPAEPMDGMGAFEP